MDRPGAPRLHAPMRARVVVLVACLALPPISGCVVAAAAAVGAATFGVISYCENEATMDVPQDLPTVFAAAKKALHNLSFPVDDKQTATATEGRLEAADAHVRVERQPGGTTRVRARVGTFDTSDNQRRAKLILEEIKKLL